MIELEEEQWLYVTLTYKPDFDEACGQAMRKACINLGIDDDGNSDKVKGWKRSEHSIKVKFVSMSMSGGMGGWNYTYQFKYWAE